MGCDVTYILIFFLNFLSFKYRQLYTDSASETRFYKHMFKEGAEASVSLLLGGLNQAKTSLDVAALHLF